MANQSIIPWYNAVALAIEIVWPEPGSIFTLGQLKQLESAFAPLFPHNNHRAARIRAEIQNLEKGQVLDMSFRLGQPEGTYRRKGPTDVDCRNQVIAFEDIQKVTAAFYRVVASHNQPDNQDPDMGAGRDPKIVSAIKEIYASTCQVCNIQLQGPAGFYAECAHIRQLNGEGQGADSLSNVLCLCPNDHKRLDKKIIAINSSLEVVHAFGRQRLQPYAQLNINEEQHPLDLANLSFHYKLCFNSLEAF